MNRRALLLIPLVVGLISCGKSSSNIPNQRAVNEFKELLSKQDLSPYYSKTMRVLYTQEYDVLEVSRDEEERMTNYFNYNGSGIFGSYYDLTSEQYDSIADEKGNIDTFDAISEGKAYYGIFQSVRTTSFSRENSHEAVVNTLDIFQQMAAKSTDQDFWLYNSLDVSDTGIFNAEYTQRFNSCINKELLFSSISTRTFREILSKVNIFDAPGNIEHLDKLYFSTCRDLVSKSDKEISKFILENQITIKEEENIEVSFVFSTDDIAEEEEDYIFPGAIKGTLYYDKNTYEFVGFTYDNSFKVETYDEDTGSVKLVNTDFYAEGTSERGLPHDPWEPIDPVVYDDVAEYLKDVNEQVIPPEIYL